MLTVLAAIERSRKLSGALLESCSLAVLTSHSPERVADPIDLHILPLPAAPPKLCVPLARHIGVLRQCHVLLEVEESVCAKRIFFQGKEAADNLGKNLFHASPRVGRNNVLPRERQLELGD